mmetsp:Transcript_20768/g.48202  ORF Transcript_20768/g.48202 Transcript_20768/m.48202 type:complete len:184 (-) Transcript_20768:36-587(-)
MEMQKKLQIHGFCALAVIALASAIRGKAIDLGEAHEISGGLQDFGAKAAKATVPAAAAVDVAAFANASSAAKSPWDNAEKEIMKKFHDLPDSYADGRCAWKGDSANLGCGFILKSCKCAFEPLQYCYKPGFWHTFGDPDATENDKVAAILGHCTVQPWAWISAGVLFVLAFCGTSYCCSRCCS